MKITSVAFREAIYHNGKGSITAAEGALELHPAGVIVQAKGRDRVLVPFSNIKWLGVDAAPALRKVSMEEWKRLTPAERASAFTETDMEAKKA